MYSFRKIMKANRWKPYFYNLALRIGLIENVKGTKQTFYSFYLLPSSNKPRYNWSCKLTFNQIQFPLCTFRLLVVTRRREKDGRRGGSRQEELCRILWRSPELSDWLLLAGLDLKRNTKISGNSFLVSMGLLHVCIDINCT